MEMNDYHNIVGDIINEAVKRYHKNVETFLLKELSKMGYNFDSYELRDMFARQRLIIFIKDGVNYLYLDGVTPITAWRDYPVFDDKIMGWVI